MDHCDRELLVQPLLGLYGGLYAEAKERGLLVEPSMSYHAASHFGAKRRQSDESGSSSLDNFTLEELVTTKKPEAVHEQVGTHSPKERGLLQAKTAGGYRPLPAACATRATWPSSPAPPPASSPSKSARSPLAWQESEAPKGVFSLSGVAARRRSAMQGFFPGTKPAADPSAMLAEESQKRAKARMHEYELIAKYESEVFPRQFGFATDDHPDGVVVADLFGELVPLMKMIIDQDSQLRALLNQQRSRLHTRRRQFELRLANRNVTPAERKSQFVARELALSGGPTCEPCEEDGSAPAGMSSVFGRAFANGDIEAPECSRAVPHAPARRGSIGTWVRNGMGSLFGLGGGHLAERSGVDHSHGHGERGSHGISAEASPSRHSNGRSSHLPECSGVRAWTPHMDSKQLRHHESHGHDVHGSHGSHGSHGLHLFGHHSPSRSREHSGETGTRLTAESNHRRVSRELGDMLTLGAGLSPEPRRASLDMLAGAGAEEDVDESFSFNTNAKSVMMDAKLRRRWSFSALHAVQLLDATSHHFQPPEACGGAVDDRLTLAASVAIMRRKAEWLDGEKEYAADSHRHQTSQRHGGACLASGAAPTAFRPRQDSKGIGGLKRQTTRTDLKLARTDLTDLGLRNEHRSSLEMTLDKDTLKSWKTLVRATTESRKTQNGCRQSLWTSGADSDDNTSFSFSTKKKRSPTSSLSRQSTALTLGGDGDAAGSFSKKRIFLPDRFSGGGARESGLPKGKKKARFRGFGLGRGSHSEAPVTEDSTIKRVSFGSGGGGGDADTRCFGSHDA